MHLNQVETEKAKLYKPSKKTFKNLLIVCLVIQCFVCGAHCSMFGAQCFVLNAQCSKFYAWCEVFWVLSLVHGVLSSMHGVRCFEF